MTRESTLVEEVVVGGVPCRVVRPDEPARTGVVVLHQAPGYAPHIADWLERLAGEGHLAIAPLLLHHRGEEAIDPFTRFNGDLAAFAAFLPGDSEIRDDVDAALGFLEDSGVAPGRSGILGFSYGGRAAFLAATERDLGAAVTLYGNGIQNHGYAGNSELPALADRVTLVRTPWLGLYGEEDFLLSAGELDDLESALRAAQGPTELVRYPGAGHAFDTDLRFAPGAPSSLHAEAAGDATARTLSFLRARLPKGSPAAVRRREDLS